MNQLKIVFGAKTKICNSEGVLTTRISGFVFEGSLYEAFTEKENGFVIFDGVDYNLIPFEMGVIIDPDIHNIGSAHPIIDAYEEHCMNVKDYTKAYTAFGKDRTLDYSPQINKSLLIDESTADAHKVQR